ncbi:MAG: hypothetical protein ACLGGV_05925 [Bacteroidia bacterium]
MLATLFGKKKLTDKQAATLFVNTILDSIEQTFGDVAQFINEAPEFITSPNISENDSDKFLLIVLSANLTIISKKFSAEEEYVIKTNIVEQFSSIYNVTPAEFSKHIDDYTHLLYRVKERSSNVVYAMSKSVFHKYKLCNYQDSYFKDMNTPNPIFVRRLDQVMKNYIWNWESFLDKYKIV